LADRPGLRALIFAPHSDGAKLVVIEKLDRLAKDLMIQESIAADMRTGETGIQDES
jgi:hypothetical protein